MSDDTRGAGTSTDFATDDKRSSIGASGRAAYDGPMPRWVVVFVIIWFLIVVTFLVLHLAGGGFHGQIPG